MHERVVLYDGECGMCNYVVQWMIREDRSGQIRFAPQQGQWVAAYYPDAASWDAVGYVREGNLRIGFDAVRRMLIDLGRHWRLAGWLMMLIPSGIGNWGYALVAQNRKRFFKEPSCMLLSKEQRQRFYE